MKLTDEQILELCQQLGILFVNRSHGKATTKTLSFDTIKKLIKKVSELNSELLQALLIAEATIERLAPDGQRATQGSRDIINAAKAKAEQYEKQS